MLYRTILVSNGVYRKTIHRCRTRKTAYINYRLIQKENENVIFPKKFINTKKIKPVEFNIFLVKDIEPDDQKRVIRDKFGKLCEEPPIFNKWTVIDSSEYFVEETFWIYGFESKKDRKTILDLLQLLSTNSELKQVIVVHNKLLIYNENFFIMVICKCKKDSQRLHHTLKRITDKKDYKDMLYMGTASNASVSRMYNIILENTNWSIEKIRRTSTKP